MRLLYGLGALALTALAMPASVYAADVQPEGPAAQTGQSTVQVARASDLIGVAVYNNDNKDVGKIENLAIDPVSGKIRYAVLSFGGFLGMGDKYFAVPWSALKLVSKGTTSEHTIKEDHYVLNISEQDLKKAPGFDKKAWPDFASPEWASKLNHFYGNQNAQREGSTTR